MEKKVRGDDLELFIAVVQIVGHKGTHLGLEMEFLMPAIRGILPETLRSRLARLPGRAVSCGGVPGKRPAEDENLQVPPFKRPRV